MSKPIDDQTICLRLSIEAARALGKIAEMKGCTLAEAAQHAIGLQVYLLEAQQSGDEVIIETHDGRRKILKACQS